MRHADQPEVEVEVLVSAAPAQLWELITDIELPVRFSEAYESAVWLDDGDGPRVGRRFRSRSTHPRLGEWDSTCRVVVCKRPRSFAWVVEGTDDPLVRWHFDLAPAAGGTRLRLGARMGRGPAGLAAAVAARPEQEERLVAAWLDAWRVAITAIVEGVKAVAEAGVRSASGQ